MTDLVPINEGDSAVVRRPYNFAMVKVSKVTAAQFKASGEWSSRDHTYQRSSVVYAGSEEKAKLLLDRLTSSDALCKDEERKANERRQKRNADLITAAQSS